MVAKLSAIIMLFMLVITQAQSPPETGHEGAPPSPDQTNEGPSYWEKEFQQNAQKFYQHFEGFFVDFVVPGYHLVKESVLLTTIVLLILTIYFTKVFFGLFKGDGTKKFKYNKEEPISYADLNQHFKNFTKELDELKQQAKKGPEAGSAGDSQAVASSTVNVPELDKLTKSLGKTEEHLTKLYQENKQLNQFLKSFQKEILDSHAEIWKELHSMKTARPAASGARGGRAQSVSAEDKVPRRLQDSTPKPLETTHKPNENLSKTSDAGFSKPNASNGPGADARSHPVSNDSSVRQSQEIKPSQSKEHQAVTEIKQTESNNPFQSPTEKPEQKPPGPGLQSNPTARGPGRGPIQNRPMGPGGAFKQPPFGMTPDQQKSTTSQPPEQKEEPQTQPPVDTNPTGGLELPTNTTDLGTKNNAEPGVTEEEKSTTGEQTNPEQNLISGFGGGVGAPFQGLPAKKPNPVVKNNFPVPGKRPSPVPNNLIKKTPPMMNPGANFVPNPDGAGGSNI